MLLCRYILVYPQGCDVCHHLSLFLCVADYDKLLPGRHLQFFLAFTTLSLRHVYAECQHKGLEHGMHPPGWSHFAQFTIAVVNKDPKKSKYSGQPSCLARRPKFAQ